MTIDKKTLKFNKTFSVAPMMSWTNRHCRVFHRQLTKQALLYSEMVTTGAICYGDATRFLYKTAYEGNVSLQLGGCSPSVLAKSINIANNFNYSEYNLNVGCPSDRVQKGKIGAILMKEPNLVALCFKSMQSATDKKVTIKNRLAVDDMEEKTVLNFIETVANAGCNTFIIHARKALLNGLDPKKNRNIPPLNYDLVYEIKRTFPELEIIINGGITSIEQCRQHLQHVDGVMLGREAYQNPWLLSQVDDLLHSFNKPNSGINKAKIIPTRLDILKQLLPYIESELQQGNLPKHITQHWLGLYHGITGTSQFKRFISDNMPQSRDITAIKDLLVMLDSFE